MATTAIIQVNPDGEFPNAALYSAWRGFERRGREVLRHTIDEVDEMDADPEVLVFGDVGMVRRYLGRLRCEPFHLDYDIHGSYLGRDIRRTTLGEVRRRFNEEAEPVFIKPVFHKEFTGHVVRGFRDLIRTNGLSSDTEIYEAEVVNFISEWRAYIEGEYVVGVDHYKGDPLVFPNPEVVRNGSARCGKGVPAAYVIDFGVTDDGRTLVVEVNDMISVGSYGLDPMIYAKLIELRWDQLVKKAIGRQWSTCS